MSNGVRLWLPLAFLLLANLWLASKVTIENTDIDSFFPTQVHQTQTHLPLDYRIIFIHSEPEKLEQLQADKVIEQSLAIPNSNNSYMVFYKKDQQSQLFRSFEENHYMGTPVLGLRLSDEFLNQTELYLLILIPLLIPFIALLTSFRYFITLSTEFLIFSLLLISTIYLLEINLNPAYLLSLIFICLYAFTTINQVHFSDIELGPLSFSIFISIITTFMSALLLSFSEFGIIGDFGYSLMIWLGVLSIFVFSLILFGQREPLRLKWMYSRVVRMKFILLLLTIGLLVSVSINQLVKGMNIEFNPLLHSAYQTEIAKFESAHTNSQPVMLVIQANDCNLTEFECNQKLNHLQHSILDLFPEQKNIIASLDSMFKTFVSKPFSQATQAEFEQFKLATEMMGADQTIYANDRKSSYLTFSISLLTPIEEMVNLREQLLQLNKSSNQFSIDIQGRFNEFKNYETIFLDEMWVGISLILIVLVAGISSYYKSIAANISLLPALLSIAIFIAVHNLFDFKLTLMSLVALILFVGLIADNIIHILVSYKSNDGRFYISALRPILLSNVILIGSLSLVVFVDVGFLQIFGLEMSLLLLTHIVLIFLLMPSLLRYTMKGNKLSTR